MIKHSFKLIWNQKTKKFYIIMELFVLFLILLVGSVYLIQKYKLYTGGVGVDIEDVFRLSIRSKNYEKSDFTLPLTNIKKELKAWPEIKTISFSYLAIPYLWCNSTNDVRYDSLSIRTSFRNVDENFGKVLGIKILEGKWFKDNYTSAHMPLLVDVLVAEKLFGTVKNALHKIVDFNGKREIVGIYSMYKRNEYGYNAPSSFIPIYQKNRSEVDIVIKFKHKAKINYQLLSNIINKYFDKNQFIITDASTLALKKDDIIKDRHMEIIVIFLFMIFLIINIILGMVGIFGYSVKQRRVELGIRRALGSSAKKLHLLLLYEAWSLTILALIPALSIALQLQILKLFPVEIHVFLEAIAISVIAIFSLVSLCVYYPAYMATKIDAASALKSE